MLMFDAVVPVRAGAAAGAAAGNVASGAGGAGTAKFSVDPDQAQKMISQALMELSDAMNIIIEFFTAATYGYFRRAGMVAVGASPSRHVRPPGATVRGRCAGSAWR